MDQARALARGVVPILLQILSARRIAAVICAILLSSCHASSAVRRAEDLLASGDRLGARRVLIESSAKDNAALLALVELEGDLFPWHLEVGRHALEAGSLDAAMLSFEQALAIVPHHPEASRGAALTLARLHRREAARELLESACAKGRWRDALNAASVLRPDEIVAAPRGLGKPVAPELIFPLVRTRLFDRLASEIDRADRSGELETIELRIDEARAALGTKRAGVALPDSQLELRVAAWETLLGERRRAVDYSREAEAGLAGGDQLRSWRQYRLARLRNPSDPELAALEENFRKGFRERALLGIERALRSCDPDAARLALGWIDELGEGWPEGAVASREELETWIAEVHVVRAREAEILGRSGSALLAWLAAREVVADPEFDRRIARWAGRVERAPRVSLHRAGAPRVAQPPGMLEVVLPPIAVEEEVERVRVEESAGWVRTGVCPTPNPGHESDVRRLGKILLETIELRDDWLAMPPARAGLGEQRLRFHASELTRLGDRLCRVGPTHERGVWRTQQVELIQERRHIRVEQTVLLLRDGRLVGETSIAVEDGVAGRIPEGDTPSTSTPLSGGEAEAERLRLRLEGECRRRLGLLIGDLHRSEVDRLERVAHDLAARGEFDEAIEALVSAWLQADPSDLTARGRRAAQLAVWGDLEPLPPVLPE